MDKDIVAERIVDFESVYRGWSSFGIATVRMPDGALIRREIEDHGSAAAVLPYDPQRRCALLVKQFRPPVAHGGGPGFVLEAPAGLIEQEAPDACVRREAMEETGVALRELELVAEVLSMPGISTERMHLYLAPFGRAQRVQTGGGLAKEHEYVEVVEIGLDDLAGMADAGTLVDMKTLTLVLALRLRHPDLFGR